MAEVEKLDVAVYTVPTTEPESDGTLTWSATTVVVVELSAGGKTGLGFSYATGACARLINDVLAEVVVGRDVMDVGRCWSEMVRAIRNFGQAGNGLDGHRSRRHRAVGPKGEGDGAPVGQGARSSA